MEISLDALQGDPTALRAIILARHQRIVGIEAANRAYDALVQAPKIAIARLRKQRFGASSEKIEREIEQLELALESLETARAAPLRRRSRTRRRGATLPQRTPRPTASRRSAAAANPVSPRTPRARPSCSTPASAAPIAVACCAWSVRVRRVGKPSSGQFSRRTPRSSTSSRRS